MKHWQKMKKFGEAINILGIGKGIFSRTQLTSCKWKNKEKDIDITRENTEKQQIVLQYRGTISNEFVKKMNKFHPVQTIFTTR